MRMLSFRYILIIKTIFDNKDDLPIARAQYRLVDEM